MPGGRQLEGLAVVLMLSGLPEHQRATQELAQPDAVLCGRQLLAHCRQLLLGNTQIVSSGYSVVRRSNLSGAEGQHVCQWCGSPTWQLCVGPASLGCRCPRSGQPGALMSAIATSMASSEMEGSVTLLTVDEVAALLKVSKSWVYEHTRSAGRSRTNRLPHIKPGKYGRFHPQAVQAFLREDTGAIPRRVSDPGGRVAGARGADVQALDAEESSAHREETPGAAVRRYGDRGHHAAGSAGIHGSAGRRRIRAQKRGPHPRRLERRPLDGCQVGHLKDNPARDVDLSRLINVRPKWALTIAQAAALLEALPPLARTMVRLALFSGLRRGELFALRWRVVDDSPGTEVILLPQIQHLADDLRRRGAR